MSECLEENEIVDFVMRNLDPEDATRAEAHIDQCPHCHAEAQKFESLSALLKAWDAEDNQQVAGVP